MTEAEWLSNVANPAMMLDQLWNEHIRIKPSKRKLRLIAVTCAKSVEQFLHEHQKVAIRSILDVSERFADGAATEPELLSVTENMLDSWESRIAIRTSSLDARDAARQVLVSAALFVRQRSKDSPWARQNELRLQSYLIRCVIGNPFRPVTFDSSWRSSTAVALATGIYQEKAFDRLPILADALQDAGCDSDEILNHLRQPGDHCRGCWALDLVLGKE